MARGAIALLFEKRRAVGCRAHTRRHTEFMQTEPAAEAMKDDGVHANTLVILAEG
jgi:hypothetical protein